MPKMREFKFTGGEEPKTVEAMSYKKAVNHIKIIMILKNMAI